jgi:hypothetical protein
MALSARELEARDDDAAVSGTRQWDAEEFGRALPLVLLRAPFAVVEDGLQLVLR